MMLMNTSLLEAGVEHCGKVAMPPLQMETDSNGRSFFIGQSIDLLR
jgi:hypothetical protein